MAAQKGASSTPTSLQNAALETSRDQSSYSVRETATATISGRKSMEGRVIRGSKGTTAVALPFALRFYLEILEFALT